MWQGLAQAATTCRDIVYGQVMPESHINDLLLTKPEAAERLRISVRTLERYIDAGTLSVVRLGSRSVRIRRSDIDALIAS